MGKREPPAEVYRLKRQGLSVLERLSEFGYIELLYGDASHINEQPNVPYGWQFKDEKVFMPSDKGVGINLFGFISRRNRLVFEMTNERITGEFIVGQIEKLLEMIEKPTAQASWIMHRHTAIKRCANASRFGQHEIYISFICRFIHRI